MKLGVQVGFGPGHIVLDGDAAPPPLKGHSPQFSSNVRCGQRTGWTKMALGVEVGLGPGDFVLDGDPSIPRTDDTPTTSKFWPMFIVAKRLDGSRWHLTYRWALVQATLSK